MSRIPIAAFILPITLFGQVLPPCTVHTVIGDPIVFSGDGGPASAARLLNPAGVARTADGSLYISDSLNHRIRKVDPQGIISTVAGMGESGYSGDGGPASAARLSVPGKIEVGKDGNVYFFDQPSSRVIRRIRPDGIIETVAGNNKPGATIQDLPAIRTSMSEAQDFTLSPSGEVYFTDFKRILRIDGNGFVRLASGGPNQSSPFDRRPLAETFFFVAQGLHFSSDGTLLIADSLAASIFAVGADGLVKVLAGTGRNQFSGDGPVGSTSLAGPSKIITSSSGNAYFWDSFALRRIANNLIQTIPGSIPFPLDWAAGPEDAFYLVSSGRPVLRLDRDSNLSVAAGRDEITKSNVPLAQTFLQRPVGLAFDSKGVLYVADSFAGAIFRVDNTLQVITESSEWPVIGVSGFRSLTGLAIDRDDRVHFSIREPTSDSGRVLRVDSGGLSTVAGGGIATVPQVPASESTVAATEARLSPRQLAFGTDGELFIYNGDRLLHVNAQGRIGTAPVGERQLRPGGVVYELRSLSDLTAAPDGTVYAVNTQGLIYRYRNGVVETRFEPNSWALAAGMDGRIFLAGVQGLSRLTWGESADVITQRNTAGYEFGEGMAALRVNWGANLMALSPNGDLYGANPNLRRVRKLVQPEECPASREPYVAVAVNGASYSSTGAAPGTILTIFGENLGPQQLVIGAPGPNGWDRNVGGLQVLFDGIPAPIIFARHDQAAVIVPYEVQDPVLEISAVVNGVPAGRRFIELNAGAPGVFTLDASGRGQAAVLNQNFTVNGPANPAQKGSIMALYMTGGGRSMPPNRTGAITGLPLPYVVEPVSVRVDSRDAEVLYAGGAPGLVAGVEQVNFRVPAETRSGDAVPLTVSVALEGSEPVTIAVQ